MAQYAFVNRLNHGLTENRQTQLPLFPFFPILDSPATLKFLTPIRPATHLCFGRQGPTAIAYHQSLATLYTLLQPNIRTAHNSAHTCCNRSSGSVNRLPCFINSEETLINIHTGLVFGVPEPVLSHDQLLAAGRPCLRYRKDSRCFRTLRARAIEILLFCYCDKNKTNEYTNTFSLGKLFTVIMSTI
ncbi:hypothetical protein SFRURICE_019071, partial [Spodoptera frugiperda]